MELDDDEIRRFADACADPANGAARNAMLVAGAGSASGVIAKILLVPEEERRSLISLIRVAIRA